MKTPRILIVLTLALGLAGLAAAQEQSLGDVARKNRKSGTSKVLTNEDMPKGGDGVSTVGEAPAASTASSGSQGTAGSQDSAGPAAGAEEAAAAGAPDAETKAMQERLERLKYDEAGLERRIAKMEQDLEEAETEFRREMYRTGLQNARRNLDTVREQKEATEKALADSKNKPAGEAAAAQPPASTPNPQ